MSLGWGVSLSVGLYVGKERLGLVCECRVMGEEWLGFVCELGLRSGLERVSGCR